MRHDALGGACSPSAIERLCARQVVASTCESSLQLRQHLAALAAVATIRDSSRRLLHDKRAGMLDRSIFSVAAGTCGAPICSRKDGSVGHEKMDRSSMKRWIGRA